MRSLDELGGRTRRAVLKALGGTLGIAATGRASAHGWDGTAATNDHDSVEDGRPETQGLSENATVYGYHSIGGRGPSSTSGRPKDAHEGGLTEIRVHGDYVYVSMFSARGATSNRGFAIVDASDFIRAETEADLEFAELRVESFFSNDNPATAMMDLKVDDTGEYVFIGTQPISALFNEVAAPESAGDDTSSTSGTNTGSVLAVDVSDKQNPELVDVAEGFTTGIHNLFHHRIGGEDYVFACKDIESDGTAGMYVFSFDRDVGSLDLVNRWTPDGDTRSGSVGTGGLDWYCHDVTVQNDPKNGKPTVYLSYWDAGLVVLDASDPADLQQIGLFPMYQCHYAVPAPDTVTDADGNERRVAFASHEEPSSDYDADYADGKPNSDASGTVYLVDTDDIYETEGVVECGELANWTWQDDVEFGSFNLSPHNSDPAFHRTGSKLPDGAADRANEQFDRERELWLHQGHYHAGTRFLKVTPGSDRGTTVTDEAVVDSDTATRLDFGDPIERGNDATDWDLSEPDDPGGEFDGSFARPVRDVPDDSKMNRDSQDPTGTVGGLSGVQPFVWAAVQNRGVTFVSDINQGVFAVKQDDVPLKGAIPYLEVARSTDSPLFTGEQAGRVELDVVDADEPVLVRDRIPDGWRVLDGDDHETYHLGGQTAVEFAETAGDGDTLTYFPESPAGAENTGSGVFGPVEYSDDGGDTWQTLPGTRSTALVLGVDGSGPSFSQLTLGTAAGAAGVTYAQRERFRERVSDLLDGEQ